MLISSPFCCAVSTAPRIVLPTNEGTTGPLFTSMTTVPLPDDGSAADATVSDMGVSEFVGANSEAPAGAGARHTRQHARPEYGLARAEHRGSKESMIFTVEFTRLLLGKAVRPANLSLRELNVSWKRPGQLAPGDGSASILLRSVPPGGAFALPTKRLMSSLSFPDLNVWLALAGRERLIC